jgi:hypothetical protein
MIINATWTMYDDKLNERSAALQANAVLAGQTLSVQGNLVTNWDIAEVANWLVAIGYKDLVPLFHQSNINGVALSRLDDRLLREMGVVNVGTRLQFLNEVVKVQAIARSQWRNHVVWNDVEYRPKCCFYMCTWSFPCCCMETFCFGPPSQYTLTNGRINVLRAKSSAPCVLLNCCFGYGIQSDNTDLTLIHDVDCVGETSFFGDPAGFVIISTMDGKQSQLKLRSTDVQKVTSIINNIREEAIVSHQTLTPSIDNGPA